MTHINPDANPTIPRFMQGDHAAKHAFVVANKGKEIVFDEQLDNGNIFRRRMVATGTMYNAETPRKVIDILESLRQSGKRVLVYNGDAATGRAWGDVEAGRIGRSTGWLSIPLIVATNEDGGPGLLDSCIVRIEYAGKNGGVLYQHPNFTPPLGMWNGNGWSLAMKRVPAGTETIADVEVKTASGKESLFCVLPKPMTAHEAAQYMQEHAQRLVPNMYASTTWLGFYARGEYLGGTRAALKEQGK